MSAKEQRILEQARLSASGIVGGRARGSGIVGGCGNCGGAFKKCSDFVYDPQAHYPAHSHDAACKAAYTKKYNRELGVEPKSKRAHHLTKEGLPRRISPSNVSLKSCFHISLEISLYFDLYNKSYIVSI